MSSPPKVRLVNVVPQIKIKKELPESDDEDCVSCKICQKSFATETALNNHARMEHISVFLSGNSDMWTMSAKSPSKDSQSKTSSSKDKCSQKSPSKNKLSKNIKQEIGDKEIQIKTEELLSQMEPTNLMSLADENVSYIIIKSEIPIDTKTKSKTPKSPKPKRQRDTTLRPTVQPKRRELVVQPITGPFECLEPSSAVAEGRCHQIFFSCCEYSLHFRDEHTKRRKANRCQVCEKPLLGGDEFQSPYPCEICSMGFDTSKALSDHLSQDHEKLKPFACNTCGKRFTQQGGLQQHMRSHTGERPFFCVQCAKRFTQKSGLDQHMRVHTKVKPFRCIVCSKSFCQSIHLKQHMRTHTNVAPFQCGICSMRFKQSSHLNYHLRYHSASEMTPAKRDQYEKLMKIINAQEARKQQRTYIVMSEDQVGEVNMEDSDGNVIKHVQVTMEEGEVPQDQILIEEDEGNKTQLEEGEVPQDHILIEEENKDIGGNVVVERCLEDGVVWNLELNDQDAETILG